MLKRLWMCNGKIVKINYHKVWKRSFAEPCPPKNLQSPSSPPPTSSPCSNSPPCPPPSQSHSAKLCPAITDNGNPCLYCPPPPTDPDGIDLTKLKKYQCLFQQDNGLPIHLKRGAADTVIFQITTISVILSIIASFYAMYLLANHN